MTLTYMATGEYVLVKGDKLIFKCSNQKEAVHLLVYGVGIKPDVVEHAIGDMIKFGYDLAEFGDVNLSYIFCKKSMNN